MFLFVGNTTKVSLCNIHANSLLSNSLGESSLYFPCNFFINLISFFQNYKMIALKNVYFLALSAKGTQKQ